MPVTSVLQRMLAVTVPAFLLAFTGSAYAAHAATPPDGAVSINFEYGEGGGPGDGYPTHQGKGSVELDLSIDGETYDGSQISGMSIKLDGATAKTDPCRPPNGPSSCDFYYTFDPNAVSVGTHTLQAFLTTNNGTITSQLIHIVVGPNPGESTLTSPADGSTVSGVTDVTAHGWTEPADHDPADRIEYTLDGVLLPGGAVPCQGADTAYTCDTTYHWDTTGASTGPHSLMAQIVTASNDYLWADSVTVYVLNAAPVPAILTLTPGAPLPVGSGWSVHGTVVDKVTHQPLANVPVTVTTTDQTGTPTFVLTYHTAADGTWQTGELGLVDNTKVSVTTGPGFPSTDQSTTIGATVPLSCVVPGAVQHGQPLSITCHAGLLAWHSVVALKISGGSVPHATLFGKIDHNGNVTFTEDFVHPNQHLTIKATTATTRLYTASGSAAYELYVR